MLRQLAVTLRLYVKTYWSKMNSPCWHFEIHVTMLHCTASRKDFNVL